MNKILSLNDRLLVPHDCYLILTSKCNMRCRHCYGKYGDNITSHELTGAEWEKVFVDLEKNDIFFLNISGGEPTVHPDFIEIINSLIRHKIYFILTTNAVFNKNILDSIISAKDYLVGLKISLDGASNETHSFLRKDIEGKSNKVFFYRTIDNLKQLKKAQIPFSIATCLHRGNYKNLDDLLNLIIKLSPVSWFISTISIDGRSKDNLDIFVSEKEVPLDMWQKILRTCAKHNIYTKFIDMPMLNEKYNSKQKSIYTCPAAKLFCEINSDGQVSPCPLSRLNIPQNIIKFENIKNKSIKEIWNGDSFTKFLNLSREGCDGCIIKEQCGRCIPQSYAWFNTHNKPTPYCISKGEDLKLKNLEQLKQELRIRTKQLNRTILSEENND